MSVKDVMAELGVGQRTVYGLIDDDGLPAYKIGRVIRIRRADFDAWLERQRIEPGGLHHLHPWTERRAERTFD